MVYKVHTFTAIIQYKKKCYATKCNNVFINPTAIKLYMQGITNQKRTIKIQ